MFLSFDSTQTPAVKVWNLVNTITGSNSVEISLNNDCAPIQVIILGGTGNNVNIRLPSNPPLGKTLTFRVENYGTNTPPNVIMYEGNSTVSSISSSQSVQLVYITSPLTLASGNSTNWVVLSGATSSNSGNNSANTIVGGTGNKISGNQGACFIGAGSGNSVTFGYGSVVGGIGNSAYFVAAVVGGQSNTAGAQHSFIGAGVSNNSSGNTSAVVGGSSNTSGAQKSFIGAGGANSLYSGADNAAIAGGVSNTTYGPNNFIGAGYSNTISTTQWSSVIGGGEFNTNTQSVGTIVGGHSNTQSSSGSVTSATGTITNNILNATAPSMALAADNSSVAVGQYVTWGQNGDSNYINAIVTSYAAAGSTFATTGRSFASSTVTVTHAGGTSYAVGSWITISGVTPSAYNNTWIVTASSAGSVSFANFSDLGAITVQGTIKQPTTVGLSRRSVTNGFNTVYFWKAGAFIGGGVGNTASGYNSVVVGGGYDGTTTNGNTATGNRSFIGAGYKNTVGVADSSIVGGEQNTISATGDSREFIGGGGFNTCSNSNSSIVGGYYNTVSGSSSFVGGGNFNTVSGGTSSVLGGNNNTANASLSVVLGGANGNTRSIIGYTVIPASNNPIQSSTGVQQSAILVLGRATVDATATVLASDTSTPASTNQLILPNNSAYYFKGSIVAGVTAGGNSAMWSFEGGIKRGANAATTALVGTPVLNLVAQDAGASTWVVALTADTTNGGLRVTVTGQAATTIRWVAKVETTEMTY
jgi:hypothetical protein